jgi:hypothetical protein
VLVAQSFIMYVSDRDLYINLPDWLDSILGPILVGNMLFLLNHGTVQAILIAHLIRVMVAKVG